MLGPWDYSSGCNLIFAQVIFSGEVRSSLGKLRVNLYRRMPRKPHATKISHSPSDQGRAQFRAVSASQRVAALGAGERPQGKGGRGRRVWAFGFASRGRRRRVLPAVTRSSSPPPLIPHEFVCMHCDHRTCVVF